jgi:maleate isomerase
MGLWQVPETARAGAAVRWPGVHCTLDERPWPGVSIGLIALAGDAVIEPELRVFLGARGHLHTTRVSVSSAQDPGDMAGLRAAIPAAAALLLPGGRVDVVAFGCTSAAAALGSGSVGTMIRRRRPGAAATDPLASALAEFTTRGVRSIALLSPYPDTVSTRVAAYLSDHGVRVVAGATLRAAGVSRALGRTPANLISPPSILDAVIELGRSGADAVFISCTGLRCAAIIGQAEKSLCKPVICSNQALVEHALRLARQRDHPAHG